MNNLRLPNRKFLTVALLVFILTALSLSGFFVYRKVTQPKIDTSNWQTYRNEGLGFEIKLPPGWIKRWEFGPRPDLENEFWRDQAGEVEFLAYPALEYKYGPHFNVKAKDSDLSFEKFMNKVTITKRSKDTKINTLPAKKSVVRNYQNYHEIVVVKNGKRYYDIDFITTVDPSEDIEQHVSLWDAILKTFKTLNQ